MQKAAFEALQVKKDLTHRQIRSQVSAGRVLICSHTQTWLVGQQSLKLKSMAYRFGDFLSLNNGADGLCLEQR